MLFLSSLFVIIIKNRSNLMCHIYIYTLYTKLLLYIYYNYWRFFFLYIVVVGVKGVKKNFSFSFHCYWWWIILAATTTATTTTTKKIRVQMWQSPSFQFISWMDEWFSCVYVKKRLNFEYFIKLHTHTPTFCQWMIFFFLYIKLNLFTYFCFILNIHANIICFCFSLWP